MADLGEVTRTLLGFDRATTHGHGLAHHICTAYVDGLDVDGAAISLLTASAARETLWATDAVAEMLEDLQFTLNEGACMQAATTGYPVLVPDLRHDTETARWPIFAAAVLEQTPVGALFAVPLQWGTVNLGVLDLYRVEPGNLSEAQWRDALAAADTAALLMLGQRTDPDGAGDWLDPTLNHRAEIHQATGMVIAQLQVSAIDAIAALRAHAFVQQRLLIDIAHDVVNRRLVFTSDSTDAG